VWVVKSLKCFMLSSAAIRNTEPLGVARVGAHRAKVDHDASNLQTGS
jgi:hypothetical protein